MRTEDADSRHVIATGGGLLGSKTWTRIMADALGRPITASVVTEASSRGAALLALETLGGTGIEDIEAPSAKPTIRTYRITRSTKKP